MKVSFCLGYRICIWCTLKALDAVLHCYMQQSWKGVEERKVCGARDVTSPALMCSCCTIFSKILHGQLCSQSCICMLGGAPSPSVFCNFKNWRRGSLATSGAVLRYHGLHCSKAARMTA